MWETLDFIPLFPLLGVVHFQPIVHVSKTMVQLYYTDESIIQLSIGYMIYPSLHVNKVFREQVENLLNATFHENTMENIRYVLKNKIKK